MFDSSFSSFKERYDKHLLGIVDLALSEDIGDRGDITSRGIFGKDDRSRAFIFAREGGVLAGFDAVEKVYERIDRDIVLSFNLSEGDSVMEGGRICVIEGRTISILEGERVALNFLSHLSGVATYVSHFVDRLGGSSAQILDTRKTLPGMRYLEKRAVILGGGVNHRLGLYDKVLIKDNHIEGVGSIVRAVSRIRSVYGEDVFIEVEARNIEEVKAALNSKVSRILLDNMRIDDIRKAVFLVSGRCDIEVSGNVSLENVGELAGTGVEFISIGSITMSSKSLDLSLVFE